MAKESIAAKAAAAAAPAPAEGQLTTMDSNFLPALFGQNSAIEVQPRFNVPYLLFAQPAAKEQWKDLVKKFPNIEDGDPILVFPEPDKPIRLNDGFKCTMLTGFQYYATRDGARGGVDKDFYKKQGGITDSKDPLYRAERIIAALIIFLPDGRTVACTCKAKGPKTAAFHEIKKQLDKCVEPDWIKESPAHEMAVAACAAPFARIVANVTTGGHTGRKSSIGYVATDAVIAPSTAVEWKALKQFETPQGMKTLKEVADAYNAGVKALTFKEEA